MTEDERTRHLLNYLAMLIYRSGGRVVIDGFDEFTGRNLTVRAEPDIDNDRVTLTVEEEA